MGRIAPPSFSGNTPLALGSAMGPMFGAFLAVKFLPNLAQLIEASSMPFVLEKESHKGLGSIRWVI